jgi:phosphatidylinositol alpha 1,6-mannosyltransferase
MLEKMNQWGYGTCAELYEWGRGVDLKIFTPDRRSLAFRESKHMLDTDVVVIWVGRLVPEKRPDIWLNTVKRLQNEGLPVKAIVVGNGTFEKTLAQLKNVTCCGWLSGPALGEAYASSDVLLFPSDVETFGNVTLEALASGCPCVVEEKCGGHLVEHGVNGFTCPAGDFEAFYQATKRIVQDVALRKQMAVKSREGSWAFERHKIMQQMLENYKVHTAHHPIRSTRIQYSTYNTILNCILFRLTYIRMLLFVT